MNARDIGAHIIGRQAGAVMATAAGAGDATELDGRYIDRSGYLSAKLIVAFKAVLGDGETLSIAANLQDDADGAGAGTDFGSAFASAVVATGPGGGGTVEGQVELDFDLSGARQYVRAQFTPDLSAGAADTAIVAAVLVLGGADEIPAS